MSEIPSFSCEVADLLAESTCLYLDVLLDLSRFLEETESESDSEVIAVLQGIGLEMAGRIAKTNRLIDDARIKGALAADPAHDPRVVQPVLRILGDSFVLLATSLNRDQIRSLPLIEANVLRRAVWREQIYSWVTRCGSESVSANLGLYAGEVAASQIARASE